MRSRVTGFNSAKSCEACHLSTSRYGARRLVQVQLSRAIITEPDKNMRSVGPKEGRYFSRHLYRFVNAQSLQSLNVKYAIVEITFSAFFPMNTLPLTKRLSGHADSPMMSGLIKCVSEKTGQTTKESEMMPLDQDSVNKLF
jgi:hypothetical protein